MGNTVISSILFQPPSPPNVLEIPITSGAGDNTGGGETTLATKRYANLSIDYLWIYSKNNNNNNNSEEEGEDEYNLIPAIHIQHKSTSNNNPILAQTQKYTLLYSHGNAEDIGLISSFLIDLSRLLQVNVICYDYSGYGISIEESTYVSQFYNVYGREINAWKLWCKSFGGLDKHRWEQTPGGCRYSRDVFVAPIIHPNEGASCNGGGMDELMFSTSYVNDERVVQQEEESGGACDFSNACGDWSSPTPTPHHHESTPYERSISSSSTRQSSFNNMDMSGSSRHSSTSQHRHSHHNSNLLNSHTWSVPTPSEKNCYANISSVYSYLTSVEGIPSKHIILYGKSVGSGPTCWLAQQLCQGRFGCNDLQEQEKCSVTDEVCFATESREPIQEETRTRTTTTTTTTVQKRNLSTTSEEVIGGVVLHSPFLSVIRVVFDVGFTTVGDLFPNIDRVGDLTCPVYVIHGSNDEVVPFYHGETLFQTLPDKALSFPFWARGAGHNNIEMDMPTAFIKRLQQFIRQCDRLNYPNQLSPRKQAKLQQQKQAQEQHQNMMMSSQHARTSSMHHLGHPPSAQYAPQDSYHVAVTPPQIKPSKQRKKKGTLVMRSTHNQMQVAQSTVASNQEPLPPPPTNQRWSPRGFINSSRSQGLMNQHQQQYVSSSTNHGRQVYSRSVSDSYSPSSSSPSYQSRKFMLHGKRHQPQQQLQRAVQEQQYYVSRGYRE